MNESSEKRFDATPSRRERAMRDGNSARSSELSGIASFACALAALATLVPLLANAMARAVRASAAPPFAAGGLAVTPIALACVPALAAAVAGVGATFAQTGGLRPAPVRFALAKLAPVAGFKRMFGMDGAVGALRALIALGVTLAAVFPIAAHVVAVAIGSASPFAAAQAARDGAFGACAVAACTGAIFAVADYALVRRRWLRSLRMTLDEVKRDAREQDGDPHARSRRRQIHRSIARGSVQRTREASFVVVNPTHVSVALRYAPPAVPVPEILVRAVDDAALVVRGIAQREGIPIVESAALARWLFRVGESGRPIPSETFVAVAEVIAALVRSGALDV